MALLRNCFSFLLLILVARLLPQDSLSAPVKKVGPFRRAEDVQEFVSEHMHALRFTPSASLQVVEHSV